MPYTPSGGYNPCDENTVAAKIWECLRRNTLFKTDLSVLRDPKAKDRASSQIRISGHPFASAFWDAELNHTLAMGSEAKEWPQLLNFQDVLRAIAGDSPRIAKVPVPPVESVGRLANLECQQAVEDWLKNTSAIWHTFDVFAAPKEVRDEKQRRALVRQFSLELLSQPSGRTQDHGVRGKEFGKRQWWDEYLTVERLCLTIPLRQTACGYAIWQLQDRKGYDSFPKKLLMGPTGIKRAEKHFQSYGTNFTGRIDRLVALFQDIKVYPGR